MRPLRAAILGCGSFANRHAQTLYSLTDEVQMVAFCNPTLEKAIAFSDRYAGGKALVFSDHHLMFAEADLDLVVICMPPYAHTDEVEVAADHGVNLLIEKPIALTSEHGWRMVAAAERAGIKSQVGFKFRFGEAVERMKSAIQSGEAGPVGLMSARYFCNALHAPWWRDREKSGGQLIEQVIHMIDLMRYMMGEAVTAYSRQANLFHRDVPGYTVEDVSATIFGFASGGIGVIYATNSAIPNRWINDYRVVTQRITAEFSSANNAVFTYTGEGDRPPEVISSDKDIHCAEMLDLLTAIRTGGETRVPLREGAKSLDLALAATRSAEQRAEVQV